MNDKVKITHEQAEKIRGWQAHTGYPTCILLELHVNNTLTFSKCLQNLTLDELARAIYIGYEVEEEFKVGDFVVYVHDGTVYQVVKKITEGNTHHDIIGCKGKLKYSVHRDHIRHATPTEIAAEIERRMNKKLDQILLDLSDGERDRLYKKLEWGDC